MKDYIDFKIKEIINIPNSLVTLISPKLNAEDSSYTLTVSTEE